ncbi:hypothetical protein SpCBS45565_g02307 [Spizellomyces sp. 'palustris']|nr:hypothetical protein SpCBS45565_g02307 [Spizellomyces sp. 'palustris']
MSRIRRPRYLNDIPACIDISVGHFGNRTSTPPILSTEVRAGILGQPTKSPNRTLPGGVMVADHVQQNVIMVAEQSAPDGFQSYSVENTVEVVSHTNGIVEVADQLKTKDMSTLATVSEVTSETPQLGSNDSSSSNKRITEAPAGQETVIDLVDSEHVVSKNSTMTDRLAEVVFITSESDDEDKLRSKSRKGRRPHNVKACIVNLVQEERHHRKRLRKKYKTHPQVIAERIVDHDLIDLTQQSTETNATCRYVTGQKREEREPAKLATESAAGDDPCHSVASIATESLSISHVNGSFSLDSSNLQPNVVVESSSGSAFPVSSTAGLAGSRTTGDSNVHRQLSTLFDGVRPDSVPSRTITNSDGLLAGAIPVKIGFPDTVLDGLSSISDFLKAEKVAVCDRSFEGKSSATRSKSRMPLAKVRLPGERYPPRFHPGNLSEMWLKAESDRLSAFEESDDESLAERRLKKYRKRARRSQDSDPQIAIKRPRATSATVETHSDGTIDDTVIESTPCPASSSEKDEEDDVDVGYQPLPLFGRAQVHQMSVRRVQKSKFKKRQPVNDKLYDVRANMFTGVDFAVVGCGQVSIWTSIPGRQTMMKRKWDLSKQMPLNPLVYAGIDLVDEPPDVFCCDWLYDEKEAKCHIAAGGSDGFLMVFDADTGEYKVRATALAGLCVNVLILYNSIYIRMGLMSMTSRRIPKIRSYSPLLLVIYLLDSGMAKRVMIKVCVYFTDTRGVKAALRPGITLGRNSWSVKRTEQCASGTPIHAPSALQQPTPTKGSHLLSLPHTTEAE